jgi:hypothetical protein
MLVPMLQALHMHIPMLTAKTQTEHLHSLAQVCCELPNFSSRKDLEDATIFSLEPWTRNSLRTLRFVFNSAESRDGSQKILNYWSSFTPEESNAIDMIRLCSSCNPSRVGSFVEKILACIEHYEITNNVLHVGVFF